MTEEFSLIAFFNVTSNLDKEISINGVSLLPKNSLNIESHWLKWLGSMRSDEILKSNLILLCKSQSDNPDMFDGKYRDVQKRVFELYHSLILYGVPGYETANMLTGTTIDKEVSISEVGSLDYFYVGHNGRPHKFTLSDIPMITRIHEVLIYKWI